MHFFKTLLGLLAVGFAAADYYDSSRPKYNIRLHEIHYPPSAPFQKVIDGHFSKSTINMGLVADIANTPGGQTLDGDLRPIKKGLERADLFQAYFRAPLAAVYSSKAPTDVYLIFSYSVGTVFLIFQEKKANKPNFKHLETLKENSTHAAEVYKVTCLPGVVFPIRVIVFGAGKDETYKLEWTLSLKYDSRQSLGTSTVDMKTPKTKAVGKIQEKSLSPTEKFEAGNYITLPLHGPMTASSLEKLVFNTGTNKEFLLVGYFQLKISLTMLVLSSTTSVTAEIYAPKAHKHPRANPAYYHSTLLAYEDVASQVVLDSDPGLLHKIVIRGKFDKDNRADFTLMAYNPRLSFEPTVVKLLVPRERPWEREQPDVASKGGFFGRFRWTPPSGFYRRILDCLAEVCVLVAKSS